MPERYTPKDWPANKFAAELWLARALESHPWRVETVEEADLVLMETNLSLACRVGKMFTGRSMWRQLSKTLGMGELIGKTGVHANVSVHPLLRGMRNDTFPAVVLTDNECPGPWTGFGQPPGGLIKIKDHGPGKYDSVAPFVLSRPPWLVGRPRAKLAPQEVPWDERKLLFFAGHVPKLYIQPSRYQIWRQMRRWPKVTAISATINCTIGAMSICNVIRNCSDDHIRKFCIPFCSSHVMDDLRVNVKDQPWLHRNTKAPVAPQDVTIRRCGRGRLQMIKQCKSYKRVNFTDELPDMAASTRNLPPVRYFEHAMGHKFCLAAPGDFVSTPKITEYVAMGAAGGCLPLMVLAGDAWRTLPYVRWIDWCKIAFIVDEHTAKTDMPRVLRKLEQVTAEQAAEMRRALLEVRDAFVWRDFTVNTSTAGARRAGATPKASLRPRSSQLNRTESPSAADYLLGELCEAARRKRLKLPPPAPLGGPLSRCML